VGRAVLPTSYGVMLRSRPGDYTLTVAVLGTRDGVFLARIIRERLGSDNFLDIGANQGVFSLVAAKALRESGRAQARVVSFEPNPAVFAALCENIALNRAKNVMPFCAALVSEDRRLATLSFRGGHSRGASLKKRPSRRVPVLCVNHELLDQPSDEVRGGFLVKIDVEGSENEVLTAVARSRIADRVSGVIVKLHPQHNTADELAQVERQPEAMGLREVAHSQPNARCDAYFARA
jgi:FkbM family methyltransferase